MRQRSATMRDRSTGLSDALLRQGGIDGPGQPPRRRRPARSCHASSHRKAGPIRPIAPTIPSSRKTGAAMATEPSMSSPSLTASPVMTIPPRPARSSSSVGVRSVMRTRSWARTSSRTSRGANASRTRPSAPAYSGDIAPGSRVTRSASSDSIWWRHTRRQADPPDDDRGLAGLVDEHPQRAIGMADETLAADIEPVPMSSFGPSRNTPPCRSTNPKSPSVRR